ncbi:MAG: WD40/YVTN/BNR-like repeat-containing protein, partial [Acidobacteriota bacterium]
MMWEKYFLGHGAAVLAVVFSLSSARASEPELSREAHLGALRFRSIGPAVMGGRIDDIAVAHDRPWIVYVGSASGGLWKTENNGTTWTPVFDDQRSSSVGDVALAPSDTGIVWVGTGEPNNRQSSTFGDGVYRSIDGGRT